MSREFSKDFDNLERIYLLHKLGKVFCAFSQRKKNSPEGLFFFSFYIIFALLKAIVPRMFDDPLTTLNGSAEIKSVLQTVPVV